MDTDLYSLFLQAGQDMQYFYTLPPNQRQKILDRIEKLNTLKNQEGALLLNDFQSEINI